MECRKVQQFLDAFVADELDAPERQAIEEHLAECPLCQKEAQAIRRTLSLLGEFPELDPPPAFVQELRQRIESRQRPRILERLLSRPVFARVLTAVTCVLIAGFGVYLAVQQFLPPTKLKKRDVAEKLNGEQIALHRGREEAVDEFGGVTMARDAISESLPEFFHGSVRVGESHLADKALPLDADTDAATPPRGTTSPDEDMRVTRALDGSMPPAGRPAEPPPAPEATVAPAATALAGYVAELEDRERLGEELHDGEAARTVGKPAPAEPGGDLMLSKSYERAKEEQLARTELRQMARARRAGVELKLEKEEQGVLSGDKREPAAFGDPASQEAGEMAKDEKHMILARPHAVEAPAEEAPSVRTALPPVPAVLPKEGDGLVGEDLYITLDTANGAEYRWEDMSGQAGLEQEDSAPERWFFFGIGNLVKGYDRFDSPTPELVMYVRDIPQARTDIQKAVAEVGGSVAEVAARLKSQDVGEEELQESSGPEPAVLSLDAYTAFPIRGGRTDSLVVRLKAGTYEAFHQNLFPRRAAVASGPQPAKGTKAIAHEKWAKKEKEELTLVIRLIEVTEQPNNEVLPAGPQPQSP
jgi:hypothetical protein